MIGLYGIRWQWAVCCCLLLVVAASPVCAQRQASPALQALAAQDYAACLTHAATELAGVAQRSALEPVLAVALALEKTQGWTARTARGCANCSPRPRTPPAEIRAPSSAFRA